MKPQFEMACVIIYISTSFILMSFSTAEAGGEMAVTVDKVVPKRGDQYVCSRAFEIKEPNIFISGFIPKSDQDEVHHFLLFSIKFVCFSKQKKKK